MLLFYLSISGCFSGLLAQSLYAILIGQYFDKSYCSFEIIGEFFAVFLPHASVYAIGAIAFDRYARMRFFNRYPVVVTKQKIIATCSVITFVSLCEGLLYAFGSKFNFFHISRNFVHVIDFFAFASVVHVIDFFASAFAFAFASEQCDQPNILQNVSKTMTILASKILVAIESLYGIYIAVAVVYMVYINNVKNDLKPWLNFALLGI